MTMKTKLGVCFMVAGVLAVFAAAGFQVYSLWDENKAAEAAAQVTEILIAKIAENEMNLLSMDTEYPGMMDGGAAEDAGPPSDETDGTDEMAVIEIDGEFYIGVLMIPALGIELPVNHVWSYPKLKISPCGYSGSIYNNTLVIAAHNYKKHFGNIAMLAQGDQVILTDAYGTEHLYQVEEITTVKPTSVEDVVNGSYDLTLFTCTYNGQARVVVRCMRVY